MRGSSCATRSCARRARFIHDKLACAMPCTCTHTVITKRTPPKGTTHRAPMRERPSSLCVIHSHTCILKSKEKKRHMTRKDRTFGSRAGSRRGSGARGGTRSCGISMARTPERPTKSPQAQQEQRAADYVSSLFAPATRRGGGRQSLHALARAGPLLDGRRGASLIAHECLYR